MPRPIKSFTTPHLRYALICISLLGLITRTNSSISHHTLEPRAGFDLNNGLGDSSQTLAPDPTAGLPDPCGQLPLTQDTWNKLEVDKYIANYPNIEKLTLAVQYLIRFFFFFFFFICSFDDHHKALQILEVTHLTVFA